MKPPERIVKIYLGCVSWQRGALEIHFLYAYQKFTIIIILIPLLIQYTNNIILHRKSHIKCNNFVQYNHRGAFIWQNVNKRNGF